MGSGILLFVDYIHVNKKVIIENIFQHFERQAKVIHDLCLMFRLQYRNSRATQDQSLDSYGFERSKKQLSTINHHSDVFYNIDYTVCYGLWSTFFDSVPVSKSVVTNHYQLILVEVFSYCFSDRFFAQSYRFMNQLRLNFVSIDYF